MTRGQFVHDQHLGIDRGYLGFNHAPLAVMLLDLSTRRYIRVTSADCVAVEINQGGDLVAQVLKAAQANLPIRTVRASRGKFTRAEPIALLYEQARVHHCGTFPALEDEMCCWVPGAADSPDRVDSLVWALTELKLGDGVGVHAPTFTQEPSESRWGVLKAGGIFGSF